MSETERSFWESLGKWWRSTSGGQEPNQEFNNLVDSSVEVGSKVWTPDNPIWTDANSDAGLLMIVLFFGVIFAFKGGKYLTGLDWYSLLFVIVFVCAVVVFVSNIWYQYVQPFLQCLL